MKKALITGGAGFIGYHLSVKLISKGFHVDILDNFTRAVKDQELLDLMNNQNVNVLNLDLLDEKNAHRIEKNYDYIYHFAAIIGVDYVLKSPFDVIIKNFLLLNNALTIAKSQSSLKKFIFASTSEVYAGTLKYYGLKFPTIESTPLTITNMDEPRTSYMLSKIYGEAACLHSRLPIMIIRPHNFYGPRMGMSHVIPQLMKKVINTDNGKIDVYSTKHKRTFCYIEDAVEIIFELTKTDKSVGGIFNIGNDDEEITMWNLAKKIIELIDRDVSINSLPNTPGSPKRRLPSISKIATITDYKKKYSLNKGLKKTYRWYSTIFNSEDSNISAI